MEFRSFQRPGPLSNVVAREIRAGIGSGGYRAGDKLPTEAEFSRSFEVSRSVVREAIAQLRSDGLVESRQGSGVFVLGVESAKTFRIDPSLLLHSRQLAPAFELRIELEQSAAGLAAQRRTRRQLVEMRATLREIDGFIGNGQWGEEPDYRFHVQIAEAAGNDCLRDLLEYVTAQITAGVALRRRRHPPEPEVLRRVQGEHEDILEAIAAGDTAGARAAIGAHLLGAAERLGLGSTKE